MVESSINLWPIIILLLAWTLFLELGVHPIIKMWQNYLNPYNPTKWLDENLGIDIDFAHPVKKGIREQGKTEAIFATKNKGKGGKKLYNFRVNLTGNNVMYTPVNGDWVKKNGKNTQNNNP